MALMSALVAFAVLLIASMFILPSVMSSFTSQHWHDYDVNAAMDAKSMLSEQWVPIALTSSTPPQGLAFPQIPPKVVSCAADGSQTCEHITNITFSPIGRWVPVVSDPAANETSTVGSAGASQLKLVVAITVDSLLREAGKGDSSLGHAVRYVTVRWVGASSGVIVDLASDAAVSAAEQPTPTTSSGL
jgi:hypothetical protein